MWTIDPGINNFPVKSNELKHIQIKYNILNLDVYVVQYVLYVFFLKHIGLACSKTEGDLELNTTH